MKIGDISLRLLNANNYPNRREIQEALSFYPTKIAETLIEDLKIDHLDFKFPGSSLHKLADSCLKPVSFLAQWVNGIKFGEEGKKILEGMNHFAVNRLLEVLLNPQLPKQVLKPLLRSFKDFLKRNQALIASILIDASLEDSPVRVDKERAIYLITKIADDPVLDLMRIMKKSDDDSTYNSAHQAIRKLGENFQNGNLDRLLSTDFLNGIARTNQDVNTIYTDALSALFGFHEKGLSFNDIKETLFEYLVKGVKPNRHKLYQISLSRILNHDPDNKLNQELIAQLRKNRHAYSSLARTWTLLTAKTTSSYDIHDLAMVPSV